MRSSQLEVFHYFTQEKCYENKRKTRVPSWTVISDEKCSHSHPNISFIPENFSKYVFFKRRNIAACGLILCAFYFYEMILEFQVTWICNVSHEVLKYSFQPLQIIYKYQFLLMQRECAREREREIEREREREWERNRYR